MRILISGAGGFVGRHLLNHLCETTPEAAFYGMVLDEKPDTPCPGVQYFALDLKDETALRQVVEQAQPDHIYHLAAQASPRRSFSQPWETLENNIRSQLNVFLACLSLGIQPRILIVSSAEIYGPVQPDQLPIRETAPLRPTNPYGVSKVAQDMLGLQYWLSHHLPILRARPFNHFGPGQSEGFVAIDFSIQIARIEAGQQEPVIEVGNLSAMRDFTDVRDVVRAYRLIMEKGIPGEVYNVASGRAYSIQSLLDTLLGYSTTRIEIRTDAARMMPIDVPIIQGDTTRLREATGWQPMIGFEQTVLDILNDCRKRVRQN